MIFLSSISYDNTTDQIIDWIIYFKCEFIRINEFNTYRGKIHLSQDYFWSKIKEKEDKIYLRKFNFKSTEKGGVSEAKLSAQMDNHLRAEYISLYEILCDSFDPQKTLGLPMTLKWNKLIVLRLAKQHGFEIPFSCVTNCKNEVIKLLNQFPKLVTKPIDDVDRFQINGTTWMPFTSIITKEHLNLIPAETLFPSLIQEYIEKEFEIRVFFLDGICYSMAIFSQNDNQTSIDFRQYNRLKPNRNVPYQLPVFLQNQIKKFMSSLKLNTGSLDFIKSKDGKYFFLEINPAGQYRMMSQRCNYNLEKKVAEWLCK